MTLCEEKREKRPVVLVQKIAVPKYGWGLALLHMTVSGLYPVPAEWEDIAGFVRFWALGGI